MPFTNREAAPAEEQGYRRAPRRLELRQADFDPALGGHGWTEHCPKCARARLYGWKDAVNLQHSEACRRRVGDELSKDEKGKARIALSKTRVERRHGAAVAEDPQADHGKEEENAAAMPPENFPELRVPGGAVPEAPSRQPSAYHREAIEGCHKTRTGIAHS